MNNIRTKVAAGTTVAALTALGAVAMASGGSADTAKPSTAVAPEEIRTVVVKKVVHRTKRAASKSRTAANSGDTTTVKQAAQSSPAQAAPTGPASMPSARAAPAAYNDDSGPESVQSEANEGPEAMDDGPEATEGHEATENAETEGPESEGPESPEPSDNDD